jgi:hypothetical protein
MAPPCHGRAAIALLPAGFWLSSWTQNSRRPLVAAVKAAKNWRADDMASLARLDLARHRRIPVE